MSNNVQALYEVLARFDEDDWGTLVTKVLKSLEIERPRPVRPPLEPEYFSGACCRVSAAEFGELLLWAEPLYTSEGRSIMGFSIEDSRLADAIEIALYSPDLAEEFRPFFGAIRDLLIKLQSTTFAVTDLQFIVE